VRSEFLLFFSFLLLFVTSRENVFFLCPLSFAFRSPASGEEGAAKVSVKFPWGKAQVRRFRRTDTVRALYAYVQHTAAAEAAGSKGEGGAFDVFTAFPSASLGTRLDETVADAGLAGSQVIMRWL